MLPANLTLQGCTRLNAEQAIAILQPKPSEAALGLRMAPENMNHYPDPREEKVGWNPRVDMGEMLIMTKSQTKAFFDWGKHFWPQYFDTEVVDDRNFVQRRDATEPESFDLCHSFFQVKPSLCALGFMMSTHGRMFYKPTYDVAICTSMLAQGLPFVPAATVVSRRDLTQTPLSEGTTSMSGPREGSAALPGDMTYSDEFLSEFKLTQEPDLTAELRREGVSETKLREIDKKLYLGQAEQTTRRLLNTDFEEVVQIVLRELRQSEDPRSLFRQLFKEPMWKYERY